MLQRCNAQRLDEICDSATDALKAAQPREKSVEATKESFDLYNSILPDGGAARTCFPEQVRMVRWLRSAKGSDLAEMIIWRVPDGKNTQLVSVSPGPGHASFDNAVVKAHSCDFRH